MGMDEGLHMDRWSCRFGGRLIGSGSDLSAKKTDPAKDTTFKRRKKTGPDDDQT